MSKPVFAIALSCAIMATSANAQTMSNPNIGVIANSRITYLNPETARSLGERTTQFEFSELELSINAHLNPFMKADVSIGIDGAEGPVEIEEAYLTILKGFPISMQFKTGRYLLDFSRISQQHKHQWAWLEMPLMHSSLLGEDGIGVVGAQVSTLQSIGEIAITASFNLFEASVFRDRTENAVDSPERPSVDGNEATNSNLAVSGRVSGFYSLNDVTAIDIGISGAFAEHAPDAGAKTALSGLDLKFKWKPDAYKSINFIFETMRSSKDVVHRDSTATKIKKVTALGAFSSLQVRFRRLWDIGGFLDGTEAADMQDAQTRAFGAYVGYMPAEETARISIVYRHETSDLYAQTNNSITIQFLWSMGPHRPHQF